jgi:hypothetical protein
MLETVLHSIEFAIIYIPYTAAVRELASVVADEIVSGSESGTRCVAIIDNLDIYARYTKGDSGYAVAAWVEESTPAKRRGVVVERTIEETSKHDVRNQLIRLFSTQSLLRMEHESTADSVVGSDSNDDGDGGV